MQSCHGKAWLHQQNDRKKFCRLLPFLADATLSRSAPKTATFLLWCFALVLMCLMCRFCKKKFCGMQHEPGWLSDRRHFEHDVEHGFQYDFTPTDNLAAIRFLPARRESNSSLLALTGRVAATGVPGVDEHNNMYFEAVAKTRHDFSTSFCGVKARQDFNTICSEPASRISS